MTGERIEVWLEPGRTWRWRYVGIDDDGERVELPSNLPSPTREAAIEAARTAYPELPIELPDALDPSAAAPRRRVLLVLTGVVVVGVVVLRVRRRRSAAQRHAPVSGRAGAGAGSAGTSRPAAARLLRAAVR